MEKFNLIVLGSGPSGEKAAVKAAYFGRKVALFEQNNFLGGDYALLSLLSLRAAAKIGGDLLENYRKIKEEAIGTQSKSVEENLKNHGVDLHYGKVRFINANTIEVGQDRFCADYLLIATGAYYEHSFPIIYDQKKVLDKQGLDTLEKVGKEIAIYGTDPFCFELMSTFVSLGLKVHMIATNPLSFLDKEVLKRFIELNKEHCEIIEDRVVEVKTLEKIEIIFSNKTLVVDQFLDLGRKRGNTTTLGLQSLKLSLTREGFIDVDSGYHTSISHIFAAGAVLGPLVQGSSAMDQGRISVSKMFQTQDIEKIAAYSPYAIYTLPEIAMVGYTEQELIAKKISYICGRARFRDLVRGKLEKIDHGFLKLLFDPVSLRVLGVHILGKEASEIIHYGVSLLEEEGGLNDIIGQIFTYPSYHELYKYAAYDGLGNLSGHKIKKHS